MNDNHEALLTALLSGERSEDDPEVQAAFAHTPDLQQRWQQLRALAAQLDDHGDDARAFLAALPTLPTPHEHVATTIVPQHLAPRARPWTWLMLAAALLLGTLLTTWALRPAPPDENAMLDLRPGELWPAGAVDGIDAFRWNVAGPPQGSYVVRLRATDGSAQELPSARVHGPEWRPTTAQLAALPPRFQWELEVRDASDLVTEVVGPVLVWRR